MSFTPRVRRGERAYNASMSNAQAEEARRLWAAEDYTLKEIKTRLELRCSIPTFWRVVTGGRYKTHS
jgi:predicted DNA-binding protein (UPF0251 family)